MVAVEVVMLLVAIPDIDNRLFTFTVIVAVDVFPLVSVESA
jgi:hypothetical protein